MSLDSKTVTFAALFSVSVERELPDVKSPRNKALISAFHDTAPDYAPVNLCVNLNISEPLRASFAEPPEKKQPPLLLPAPVKKVDPAADLAQKRKKDPRYPSKQYDVVLYNTERIPFGNMKEMLQRVFHEEARNATLLSFRRHIVEGPYLPDIARSKGRDVRQYAEDRGMPVPYVRYVLHRGC